jgi:predicted secreted protein
MSNAFSGVGTLFQRDSGASSSAEEVYATIAEVNSITGPDKSRNTIDVTSLDSTAGYMEFIGSFRDGGEVGLEMNFTRDTYDLMNDDFESDSSQNYRIVLPDTGNTRFYFVGYVTALGMAIPKDDKVTSTVTIKITGQVIMES